MAIENVDLNRSGRSSSAERCEPIRERSPTRYFGAAIPPSMPSTVTAMGIFLIGLWLGTFLGIVVTALLRAAAERDLTG